MERKLTSTEAASGAAIQRAIDQLAGGGRLVLPAMELELDRGLHLRSGVEVVGQGKATVLRKGPGRIYPLSGYQNYGMCDVPLRSVAGLEVGMTVSVHDGSSHGGFYETFATITWIDGDWVGLDHGIEADYAASDAPCLTTIYPLVFGHNIEGAAIRDVWLEGNRADNETHMGGCRGGAVYFYQSRDIEISGIRERDFYGEGLSFQMCRDVVVKDCRFDENTGNGLHPGAGSTNALFENCHAEGNGKSGFFFCVRANHISVRNCSFKSNESGLSIGTRDCNNLIENCCIEDNRGAGLLIRKTPRPTEVHSCLVRNCRIRNNALESGRGQVEIENDAHDLLFVNNRIAANKERASAGFALGAMVRAIYLEGNSCENCAVDLEGEPGSLVDVPPRIECGYGAASALNFRHLNYPILR